MWKKFIRIVATPKPHSNGTEPVNTSYSIGTGTIPWSLPVPYGKLGTELFQNEKQQENIRIRNDPDETLNFEN